MSVASGHEWRSQKGPSLQRGFLEPVINDIVRHGLTGRSHTPKPDRGSMALLCAKERLYGHRRWTTGYLVLTVVARTAVWNDLNDLEHKHPKHQPADRIIDLDAVVGPELPQHLSIGMLLSPAGVGTKDARARHHKGCNLGRRISGRAMMHHLENRGLAEAAIGREEILEPSPARL